MQALSLSLLLPWALFMLARSTARFLQLFLLYRGMSGPFHKQESVLEDWINLFAQCGDLVGRQESSYLDKCLIGREPSKGWIPLFLRRHPALKLRKPSGLDPKRAQAFNRQNHLLF